MSTLPLSVIIATFNRWGLLSRLLQQLGEQTVPFTTYEVVLVDDGSADPVAPHLPELDLPYALRFEAQANAGAAVARHQAVLRAAGELIVILDDDMQVGPEFLARHLQAHAPGARRVVMGRIAAAPGAHTQPLFERWHQRLLDGLTPTVVDADPLHGNRLFTGNVSLRRSDYLAVGGFDASLAHSEDAELGLRLEKAGVSFAFAADAVSLHGSDHTDVDQWRARARLYGRFDHRISRKHPDLRHASPWRFLFELHPLARPFLIGAVFAPQWASALGRAAYGAASAADEAGFESGAWAGTTLCYGVEYFGGLRDDAGLAQSLAELGAFALRGHPRRLRQFLGEVRADFATLTRYQAKYDPRAQGPTTPQQVAVTGIGFQLMIAYRVMRALHLAGKTVAAKVVSRFIRHAYGAELHWEADLAPGVMIVHGTGLTVSRAARVGRDCILSQHVTLGFGTDAASRRTGAPTLQEGVHVGPGATLLGPITVGHGSKVMAGVVLTSSVPPDSLVEAPVPYIRPRVGRLPVARAV